MMHTNITSNFKQPKYRIGDRVKQGLIVGLESYPPNSYLSRVYGTEWQYTLMLDKSEEDLERILESNIKPLSPQELKSEIEAEINQHKQQLESLECELAELAANQLNNLAICK